MSIGENEGGGVGIEFETGRGRAWPTVTQFSVFLENRVGQLLELVRCFNGSKVRIVGLSIVDTADCCIIRLMLSHPEQGEILQLKSFPFSSNELVVCELPVGSQSLVDMCSALLQGEVNIHYAYPLLPHPHGRAAVALHVDNIELASSILHDQGFDILSESDLI